MLELPSEFILYDSEYTTWEGAQERNWGGEDEHRELVQIGAIRVDGATLTETESLLIFVKPKINPDLSEYFTKLTGITQKAVDTEGTDFPSAILQFKKWCGELPIYSFGIGDGEVVEENCKLLNIPCPFPRDQFNDVRKIFEAHGIPTEKYYSSTIVQAFGKTPVRIGHDALNDARTILDGLIALKASLKTS